MMSQRIKMYAVAFVLGVGLLFALGSTAFSKSQGLSCPSQEQTEAGDCAGPERNSSSSATHTTVILEIGP
jgi:hypothetical protein